jgi:hypothetical protein
MIALLTKYEDTDPDIPMFQCSARFIAMFKAQHRLTSRKIYFKCQPAITDGQRQRWVASIQELLQVVSWDWIIKYNEISWFLHPNGILAWAEVGTESVQAKLKVMRRRTPLLLPR